MEFKSNGWLAHGGVPNLFYSPDLISPGSGGVVTSNFSGD